MSGAEHDSSLAPGFHALEVVHRGAASTVYRALRDGSAAPAALKVLREDGGEAEVERLRELAGLPGIVGVLGRGRTTSGRTFVAMDYCAEGDYAANLRRRHPLPVEEVVRAGAAAAAALHAVHARGLLYRGVEPANLLRWGGSAVLADAGAVRPMADAPEVLGPDPGTILHAPPEALRAERAGPASDVYRLASTLWTLLAGQPPFGGGSVAEPQAGVDPFEYRDRALNAAPPRLPRADLPGALRPVLGRALAKDPDERYATAAEFAAALTGEPAARIVPVPNGAGAAVGAEEAHGAGGAEGAESADGPDAAQAATAAAGGAAVAGSADPGGPGGTDTGTDTGGTSGGTSGGTAGNDGIADSGAADGAAFGQRPEDAWAGLPGWTGTQGLPGGEPGPGAEVPHTAAGPASGTPSGPAGGGRDPLSAAAGEHGPTLVPAAPAAPEPPGTAPAQPVRRRPLYIAVAVAAIGFVVITAGAVALLRPGLGGDLMEQAGASEPGAAPSAASASPSGTGAAPAPPARTDPAAAPTGVELQDNGATVVVAWTDNSGGEASHHVVGGPVGTTPANLADTEPGTTETAVNGLNTNQEYCFTVVAVLSVDRIARSSEVCTDRGTG
ncbi:hypothetical protein GCM10027570_38520 [Streptomonospora sediminis]